MKQKNARPGGAMNRTLLVLILTLFGSGSALAFSGGDGSPENPYQVATAAHLHAVRDHLDAHFVQVADIDLYDATREGGVYANPTPTTGNEEAYNPNTRYSSGEVVTFGESKYISLSGYQNQGKSLLDKTYWFIYDIYGWEPIASGNSEFFDPEEEYFSGHYDGANYSISGLFINRPTDYNIGLFGILGPEASLENLNITGVDISGNVNIGSLVGLSFGSVKNCHATGNLFATPAGWKNNLGGLVGDSQVYIADCSFSGTVRGGRNIGGLVGQSYAAYGVVPLIENCFADADVSGYEYAIGGLVGNNAAAILRTSYSKGAVSGRYSVGGLVGVNTGLVANSYSRADVVGQDAGAGGLVGRNITQIINCYSFGSVTGEEGVGGLIGRDQSELVEENIISSYWNSETSGQDESFGGQARATAQMHYPHDASTYSTWDFVNVWAADTDGSINGGYPYLVAESTGLIAYIFSYRAAEGGSLIGSNTQMIDAGQSGSEVTAVPDAGAVFHSWSDGVLTASRTDTNVQANLEVTATFRSEGGVELDWYAEHGITLEAGQTWADLDSIDWLGKGMSLQEEFLAGTDPADPQSRFAATPPAAEGTGFSVHFQPSLPERRYTLFRTINLSDWIAVPGMQNVPGGNGPLVDAEPPEGAAFYRIEVSLP